MSRRWMGDARALLAVAALAGLLPGCGGGGTDAPPDMPLPSLSGRVAMGAAPTDVRTLEVTVKGGSGTARTSSGRLGEVDGTDYVATLNQLEGPYLLAGNDNSGHVAYSVALEPGTANLTPLTTLLVAQLLGEDPAAHFAALGAQGGVALPAGASLEQAQRRVRRYLRREFAFDLPADLGDFVTSRFAREAGDPMFDAITALTAQLGNGGDYRAVAAALGQEAGRCRVENVDVAGADGSDPFCPFSKSSEADTQDATLQVIAFASRQGDVLTVRARGQDVVDVRLVTAAGAAFGCDGAACAGLGLGTPAGDQTLPLQFAATPLTGNAGTVTLSGTLRSAVPGVVLPGLPCTDNRYFLIHASQTVTGHCASTDPFGLGAAGQSQLSGATRRVFTFDDGAGGPFVEVVTQDATVRSVLVYEIDPNTGASVARFQCRDGACPGVSLGAPVIDGSLGIDIVLQPMRMDRAVLAAVLPDGSLSGTVSVTLEATLTGFVFEDPGALPIVPVACSPGAAAVSAQPSDQVDAVPVCVPEDTQGFTLLFTDQDGDGNDRYSMAGLLSSGQGDFTGGNTVTVTVSPQGDVVGVTFDSFGGPRYRCAGPACAGVQVGAPNGSGERAVTFTGTVLQESGTGGVPADRTATLGGGFIAPPP